MNKKILTIGIVFIVAAIAAAALFLYPYQPKQPPKASDANSTPQGVQEVVNANNQFAFDLYSELGKSETGNLFYSPYSISSALAMTYEGAKGQTADEMKSVFHFPGALGPNYAAIYNDINRGNDAYELRTGNALWVQKDYPLLPEYTSKVEANYGGKAENLDFIKETEKSRETINNFIEEQTNSKIKDLIPKGGIGSSTRLVITNAVYFKGSWVWQFDQAKTSEQDFTVAANNIVKVPMMFMDNTKATFNYTDVGDVQVLELPYKGDELSMLILLPKSSLDSLEKSLTLDKLNEWKSQMTGTYLDAIYLPKFEFHKSYDLKDTLKDMGMPTAFSDSADFSGMDGSRNLYIDMVVHQAYVKVDEQGTEAAAATAVGATATSIRQPIIFRADHPFLFIMQEKKTGNILFMGRVVNPVG